MSGGIELGYDKLQSEKFLKRFFLFSRNAGINATLNFPKFIAPFSLRRVNQFNQPRTILGLGTNVLQRVNYFTLVNTSANISYNWRQNETNTWDLSPAFINLLRLADISENFQRRLDSNEYLRNTYTENFIEGQNISFTYNNRNGRNARRNYSYLRLNFEEAGGLLKAITSPLNLGLRYSQYFRVEADARHYIRRQHAELAGRVFAGVGIPYDKSSALPYIKQYFVGGPYSLRGWRVRQLGPGSFRDTIRRMSANFIDRTGDIKLEANLELRFDVVQLFGGALHLNGAVFMDAGNIWLAQPASNYPGGEFSFTRLGQDLAVSAGLGARFDISGLFVLRIDEGFPIKTPYYPNGENGGWITNKINPLNGEWLSDNLVLHIAIGYPF
jgi:outer membrane protein assembly factor BamA